MDDERREHEISLLSLINALLRGRRLILGSAVALATVLCAWTLLQPRTWSASASFVPASSGQRGGGDLSLLAAQFGVSVGGAPAESPEFYERLLRSRSVVEAAVLSTYEPPSGSELEEEGVEGADLLTLMEVEGHDPRRRLERGVRKLEDRIRIRTDQATGIVSLELTMQHPRLSRDVASRLLELVNEFNLERRQTQAAAERRFVEGQVAEARRQLETAEDSLRRFLERNRRYEDSPELTFAYERLQRRVQLLQGVYSSLAQSYEQARIEEVRNTPVITVVDPPRTPARPDPRGLLLRGVLGLSLGAILGVVASFVLAFLRSAPRREPDEWSEYVSLRAEAAAELRRLRERVRRGVRALRRSGERGAGERGA